MNRSDQTGHMQRLRRAFLLELHTHLIYAAIQVTK